MTMVDQDLPEVGRVQRQRGRAAGAKKRRSEDPSGTKSV
jgi:hypothetical protein